MQARCLHHKSKTRGVIGTRCDPKTHPVGLCQPPEVRATEVSRSPLRRSFGPSPSYRSRVRLQPGQEQVHAEVEHDEKADHRQPCRREGGPPDRTTTLLK
jgi:hypothetical protein